MNILSKLNQCCNELHNSTRKLRKESRQKLLEEQAKPRQLTDTELNTKIAHILHRKV